MGIKTPGEKVTDPEPITDKTKGSNTNGSGEPSAPASSASTLDEIIVTAKLSSRPSRPPDLERENAALVALVAKLADSPETILQKLTETALEVTDAGSAGVSLINQQDGGKTFVWPAVAGVWAEHVGGGTPRDFGPCGVVVDTEAPQLFRSPELVYPYLEPIRPRITEALLVPFFSDGKAVGTVWVVAHDPARKFDSEDLRLLQSLSRVASAAYATLASIEKVAKSADDLRASDERYRAFIEQSSEGIWRFELTEPIPTDLPVAEQVRLAFERGYLAESNDVMARMYGFASASEICNTPLKDLLMEDDPDNVAFLNAFVESGYNLRNAQSHEKDADGNDQYFLNNFVGVVEDGLLLRAWGTQRNITSAKRSREATAYLAAIVTSSADAIISKDLNGTITSWNEGAVKTYGYTAEEMIGRSISALVPEGHDNEIAEILGRIKNGELIDHYETVRRHKDGHLIDVSLTVSPIKNEAGKIIGASKISRDITAQKRSEEIADRYSALLRQARDIILFLEPDTGRLIDVNDSAVEAYGYSREQLLGMTIRDVRAPETLNLLEEQYEQARNGGVRFETIHISRDGTKFPVEVSASSAAARGRQVIISVVRDISDRREAEDQLNHNQMMLAMAMQGSRMGVLQYDLASAAVWWSPELEAIFGLEPGGFGGTEQDFYDRVHAGDRKRVASAIDKAVSEKSNYNVEFRFHHADGSIRWMEGRGQAVYSQTGDPVRVYGVGIDITDRKLLEQRILGQNEILRAVARGLPLEEILNLTTETIERELPNSMCSVLLASSDGMRLNHGAAPHLPKAYLSAIDGLVIGESVGSCGTAAYRMEPVYVSDTATDPLWKDYGYLVKEHKLAACWSHPIVSSDGALLGTFAIYFNTPRTPNAEEIAIMESAARSTGIAIERKIKQEALLAAERQAADEYKALLARIVPVGQTLGRARDLETIYRTVADFARTSMPCSGFFLSFYDPKTGLRTAAYAWGEKGEVDTSVLPPIPLTPDGGPNSQAVFERRSVVVDDYMDAMRSHPHLVLQENGVDPRSCLVVPMTVMDRVIGTLEVQAYEPAAYEHDHVVALEMIANLAAVAVENVRLIEFEASARQEAEAANRAKDEFLSVLSHELRTPLNAMLGWVRMLRSDVLDESSTEKALEVIERNTRLQSSLIEDLLDVSRIISGKMRIEPTRIDLTSVVNNVAETIRPLAAAKKLDFEVEINDAPLTMDGDALRLQQVVSNLLQNAIKFTEPPGKIKVSLERNETFARITVADTGVGIKEEFLPYIFDRFRQEDASTKRTFTGLGLGLTIVNTIVLLHGGSVAVESEGENRGSTFTINLPLQESVEDVSGDSGSEQQVPPTGVDGLAGARILLVDDDEENMVPLQLFLESHRANVTAVTSADDALRKVAESDYHIMISDIGMPLTDGYELMAEVNRIRTGQNKPIMGIALTAYASDDDRAKAIAAGYCAHLPKPVDLDDMLFVLKTVYPGAAGVGN